MQCGEKPASLASREPRKGASSHLQAGEKSPLLKLGFSPGALSPNPDFGAEVLTLEFGSQSNLLFLHKRRRVHLFRVPRTHRHPSAQRPTNFCNSSG